MKGAQLDAVDDKGWSSLMWAAINQHIDLMQLLIQKGASVYLKDKVGKTIQDHAQNLGHNQEQLQQLFDEQHDSQSGQDCLLGQMFQLSLANYNFNKMFL